MLSKRNSLTLAAMVGIGLAAALQANAQTIIQTFTIPSQSVPFSQGFTFNLFNTNLGVLGAITLELDTTITAEVDVFNATGVNQTFTNATASIPVTLTAPAGITLNAPSTAGPISGTAVPGDNTFPGLPGSDTQTTTIMSSLFPSYEGPGVGTGSMTASASSGTYSGSASPNVFFGGSAVASGLITLTYYYQSAGSIPEPGTVTFLAAGVLGSLGMVIRRRKRA